MFLFHLRLFFFPSDGDQRDCPALGFSAFVFLSRHAALDELNSSPVWSTPALGLEAFGAGLPPFRGPSHVAVSRVFYYVFISPFF